MKKTEKNAKEKRKNKSRKKKKKWLMDREAREQLARAPTSNPHVLYTSNKYSSLIWIVHWSHKFDLIFRNEQCKACMHVLIWDIWPDGSSLRSCMHLAGPEIYCIYIRKYFVVGVMHVRMASLLSLAIASIRKIQ